MVRLDPRSRHSEFQTTEGIESLPGMLAFIAGVIYLSTLTTISNCVGCCC